MMKNMLLASAVTAIHAVFVSEVLETVVVGGVRINKADYEADQQKPAGEREYSGTVNKTETAKDNAAPTVTTGPSLSLPEGGQTVPAPSAPVSVLGDATVAPTIPSPDQLLVAKEGEGKKARFFVVRTDGSRVEDDQLIDKAGYTDDKLAWAAITSYIHAKQMILKPLGDAPAV